MERLFHRKSKGAFAPSCLMRLANCGAPTHEYACVCLCVCVKATQDDQHFNQQQQQQSLPLRAIHSSHSLTHSVTWVLIHHTRGHSLDNKLHVEHCTLNTARCMQFALQRTWQCNRCKIHKSCLFLMHYVFTLAFFSCFCCCCCNHNCIKYSNMFSLCEST